MKDKGYREKEIPNTCSREEAQREGERENHFGGARHPNLLIIALFGLAPTCYIFAHFSCT